MKSKFKIFNKILIDENKTILNALNMLNSIKLDDSLSRLILFVTSKEKVVGSITDGDIRRAILKYSNLNIQIKKICNYDFAKISETSEYLDLKSFKKNDILILPVLNKDNSLSRILDLKKFKSQLPLECVIMAGGRGKRLSPLTDKIPKPMLLLDNKPIIEYNIDRLVSFGIKKIYITINYLGDVIKEYFKDGSSKGIQIEYIEEKKFLGTAGSISLIDNINTDSFILMNSDLFTDIDFEKLYLNFINQKADMAIAANNYVHDVPYAVFETDGKNIQKFTEKPSLVYSTNAGIYIIKKKFTKYIPKDKFYDITDLMSFLISKKYKLICDNINGYWIDIGSPSEYKLAKEMVKNFNN